MFVRSHRLQLGLRRCMTNSSTTSSSNTWLLVEQRRLSNSSSASPSSSSSTSSSSSSSTTLLSESLELWRKEVQILRLRKVIAPSDLPSFLSYKEEAEVKVTLHMEHFKDKGFSAADLCEGIATLANNGSKWDLVDGTKKQIIMNTAHRLLPSMSHDELAAFLWGLTDISVDWKELPRPVQSRIGIVIKDVGQRKLKGETIVFGDILLEGAARLHVPGIQNAVANATRKDITIKTIPKKEKQSEQFSRKEQNEKKQIKSNNRSVGMTIATTSLGQPTPKQTSLLTANNPSIIHKMSKPLNAPIPPATVTVESLLTMTFGQLQENSIFPPGSRWDTLPTPIRQEIERKLVLEIPSMSDQEVLRALGTLKGLQVSLRLLPKYSSRSTVGTHSQHSADNVVSIVRENIAVHADQTAISPVALLFDRLATTALTMSVKNVLKVCPSYC